MGGHLRIVKAQRIAGGLRIQELDILSISHLIGADAIRVGHRAYDRVRARTSGTRPRQFSGIPRISDGHSLDSDREGRPRRKKQQRAGKKRRCEDAVHERTSLGRYTYSESLLLVILSRFTKLQSKFFAKQKMREDRKSVV